MVNAGSDVHNLKLNINEAWPLVKVGVVVDPVAMDGNSGAWVEQLVCETS